MVVLLKKILDRRVRIRRGIHFDDGRLSYRYLSALQEPEKLNTYETGWDDVGSSR